MRIPDHFTCLLRNLYAGQEATVRTLYGMMDWFKIGKGVQVKGVQEDCILYSVPNLEPVRCLGPVLTVAF